MWTYPLPLNHLSICSFRYQIQNSRLWLDLIQKLQFHSTGVLYSRVHIACVIFEHGAILSRDTVESIANETIQSYIKKDADQQQSGNARVTRNNKPREKSHRVIIVKFVSCRVRKLVISRRRALKGTNMGMEEDHTKTNADLLKTIKDCSKVLAAWPSDGRIPALIPASGGEQWKV